MDFPKVTAVFCLRKIIYFNLGVNFIRSLDFTKFSCQTKEENRWQIHSEQFTSELWLKLLHLGEYFICSLGITFEFALFGRKFHMFYGLSNISTSFGSKIGTFCGHFTMLAVKLLHYMDIFWLFVKQEGNSGLNKGPKPSYITCSYITKPGLWARVKAQWATQQSSLAQWLHNLLGPRHPASQAQPSAQLSSHLVTGITSLHKWERITNHFDRWQTCQTSQNGVFWSPFGLSNYRSWSEW